MKTILLIDDEPNILMTLEYALKKDNYQVHIARDGLEAQSIMQEITPDVVVLDIMMPEVDGYQTLAWIQQQDQLKDTQVIFLSAKTKAEDIEKGLSLGAKKYITKPFTIKNILHEINEII